MIKTPVKRIEQTATSNNGATIYIYQDANGKIISPDQIVTALNAQRAEPSEFVKRVQENLKSYMPMLQSLNAGKGIKEDFQQALSIITRLETEKHPLTIRLEESRKISQEHKNRALDSAKACNRYYAEKKQDKARIAKLKKVCAHLRACTLESEFFAVKKMAEQALKEIEE